MSAERGLQEGSTDSIGYVGLAPSPGQKYEALSGALGSPFHMASGSLLRRATCQCLSNRASGLL